MGWLIDPAERTVFVYQPKQQPQVFDQPEMQMPIPLIGSELELTIETIFNWLMG